MVTSGWIDLADIVAGQDASTIDNSGPTVQPDFFLNRRTTQDDAYTRAATYRWGVVIGNDGLLKLQLRSCCLAIRAPSVQRVRAGEEAF